MLITFSGLDGSGKSTQIEWLKAALENDKRKVTVAHMYYDMGVLGMLRRLLERNKVANNGRAKAKRGQLPMPQVEPQNTLKRKLGRLRYRLVWNKTFRVLLYPLDVIVFRCYRFYIEKVSKQVLIMDRYFYDTVADVTENQKANRGRMLSWLAPTPDLPIYLETSAETAFARKGEFSVDRLTCRRLSYHKVNSWVPQMVVVSTEEDPAVTQHQLSGALRQRLGVRR